MGIFCKKIFEIAFLCCAGFGNVCWAMDQKPAQRRNITVINNGLLTEVDAAIVVFKSKGFPSSPNKCKEPIFMIKTLVNLIKYQEREKRELRIFAPLVFKVTKKNIENKGQLCLVSPDRELKEAIRQNKALYYDFGNGALIYSIYDTPDKGTCSAVEKYLEETKDKWPQLWPI